MIEEELQIFNSNEKIQENGIKWNENLERMEENRVPLKARIYKAKGRRNMDGPRKIWEP